MNRKFLGSIILISILFFGLSSLRADDAESMFKDTIKQIAADLQSESTAGEGLAKEKSIAIEKDLVICQNKLRVFVKNNAQSIWADDAQYVIAILSATNPQQEALELEYLLREYPNMHLEDWTRDALSLIMPSRDIPFEVMVRMQLCMDYKQSGETKKLTYICEESIKKFPEKAKIFESLLR